MPSHPSGAAEQQAELEAATSVQAVGEPPAHRPPRGCCVERRQPLISVQAATHSE